MECLTCTPWPHTPKRHYTEPPFFHQSLEIWRDIGCSVLLCGELVEPLIDQWVLHQQGGSLGSRGQGRQHHREGGSWDLIPCGWGVALQYPCPLTPSAPPCASGA